MPGNFRRTIFLHLLALNFLTVVASACLFFPGLATVHVAACLTAIAVSAIIGGEHPVGFAATVYGIVLLALLSPARDVPVLTAVGIAGFAFTAIVRAVHRDHKRGDRFATAGAVGTAGVTLLALVTYTDVSDLLMRKAPVPSVLQTLILLLLFVAAVLWPKARPLGIAQQPVVLAFGLYALVVFATSIWAREAGLVDERVIEVVKAILICTLTASLTFSWNSLRITMGTLVVAATVFSVTSIVQVTTGRFPNALGGLVTPQTGTLYEHLAMPRASGPPNSDPNFYARILLITIPLAVGLAFFGRSRTTRVASAAATALITIATLLSYSRGAILALALTSLLLLVGTRVHPIRIVVTVVTLTVALLVPTGVARRIQTLLPAATVSPLQDPDGSIEKRKLLARSGLAMLEAHPLGGVGAGHFGRDYWTFANEIGSSRIDYHPPGTIERPHSLYLEIGAETGLPGLAAFASVIVAVLGSLLRSRREARARGEWELEMAALVLFAAITGYLLASMFLHETHYRYLGLYCGLALALTRLVREEVQAHGGGMQTAPTPASVPDPSA